MFINVRLLNGFKSSLIYKIPENWTNHNLVGSIVKVPLKNRAEFAIVEEVFFKLPESSNFEIKSVHAIEQIPEDQYYLKFISQLSDYYVLDKFHFYKRIKSFIAQKELNAAEVENLSRSEVCLNTGINISLNTEQQNIYDVIERAMSLGGYYPALIHGVTGSGKTEIYKKLILKNFALKKTSIFLLPEVSLAVQFYNIFKRQLPENIPLFGFHSASSVKEKKSLWHNLILNNPIIIIGVHLPILLPINNLGLIIIDEEHETGFQEKKHPKVNSKEAALLRASICQIPIILGSATPSLSSLHNVKTKKWHLFELKKRFSGEFPKISLVKLENKKNRKNFWISNELEEAIKKKLDLKEQIIIFLNRRGYSFFIQCKSCGFIPTCVECSVSLTLHNNNQLFCHYCNYSIIEPNNCLSCKANSKEILKKGIGTQQIVKILQKSFPIAKIERADLDATINKKNWQKTLENFENGVIDILVGTQTITKGYHFPNVTLVGIIWADINLSLPIYNSSEVTLQQIIQVAGRAGRQNKDSDVIVQVIKDHPIYNFLAEKNYNNFYEYEINNRDLVQYPPSVRLAEFELKYENEEILENEANQFAHEFVQIAKKMESNIKLLGPVKPVVYKIKNNFIQKIYIKSFNINKIIMIFKKIETKKFRSFINFIPNPQN